VWAPVLDGSLPSFLISSLLIVTSFAAEIRQEYRLRLPAKTPLLLLGEESVETVLAYFSNVVEIEMLVGAYI
jgi:hypothetical protein